MRHVSDDDHQRLRAAITAAGLRTDAHLALVVTPVSDRYLLFPLIWAAAAAFAVGGLLATLWPQLPLRAGFLIEVATMASLALIFDWLPLRLLLVPRRVRREHCTALARREFAARILADHEHRPGMLLFVSLGEHHVEILADNGLHERVGEDAWRRVIQEFVAAPKARKSVVDGLVGSIENCAAILEIHYPRIPEPGR
jgi:putative membrane protein